MLRDVRIAVTFLAAGALFAALGSPGHAYADDRLMCFVSIMPQVFFVERIAGEHVETHVMVGPGQSPATYEPTTRQLTRLSRADVYFAIGVAFEESLVPKIRRSFPDVRIIDTREGIELRPMEDGDPFDTGAESETLGRDVDDVQRHTHAMGTRDPHVWLSPRLAITIAENIRDGLVSLDPRHAGEYSENCDRLSDELRDIDRRIAEVLTPIQGTEILVFHPAYGYFTDAYGLVQIAIENEGGSPGPKYLASVIDRARQRGITTIFVQEQFSGTMAKTVAKEIGADIVRLDPLAGDYMDNLLRMAEAISNASGTNRNHN